MDAKEGNLLSDIGFEKVNEYGERYFSNLNFNSFYKVSACDLYERDFSALFKKNSLYVIIGTDSGLFPKYIKQKGVPEGSRYVFIEPSFILSQLLKANALNDSDDYCAFADENTWLELLEQFKMSNYFYIDSFELYYAYCAKENALDSYTVRGHKLRF